MAGMISAAVRVHHGIAKSSDQTIELIWMSSSARMLVYSSCRLIHSFSSVTMSSIRTWKTQSANGLPGRVHRFVTVGPPLTASWYHVWLWMSCIIFTNRGGAFSLVKSPGSSNHLQSPSVERPWALQISHDLCSVLRNDHSSDKLPNQAMKSVGQVDEQDSRSKAPTIPQSAKRPQRLRSKSYLLTRKAA